MQIARAVVRLLIPISFNFTPKSGGARLPRAAGRGGPGAFFQTKRSRHSSNGVAPAADALNRRAASATSHLSTNRRLCCVRGRLCTVRRAGAACVPYRVCLRLQSCGRP
jgi:hypothetical protein